MPSELYILCRRSEKLTYFDKIQPYISRKTLGINLDFGLTGRTFGIIITRAVRRPHSKIKYIVYIICKD